MKYRNICTAVVSALFLCGSVFARSLDDKTPPTWLQQAVKNSTPVYQKDVPAVVLYDEQAVNVGPDGLLTVTSHYAVRILTRNGKRLADADALYLKNESKVREIQAWLIRADGSIKFYGKDKVLDAISDPNDIYDEYRVKSIDGSDDADLGMVFGYESVVEVKPLFTQDRWYFQGRLPSLLSRYTLSLPSGWQASSITFNRPDIIPSVNGSSYTWELRDMPPIPPEPDGLSVSNLAPRIAINYGPNNSASTFANWSDVSKWATALHDPQVIVDDEVASKAREITANDRSEFERIRSIGSFVQSLRYISIDIGVAYGNGYKPRPSSLVLGRGYGDCKDKANLMRALLKAVKIDSFPVVIFSGDPTYVRAQWPSPNQFNHCIIAVRVSKETNAPTVIENAKLGRLLIFDATDPYTPVGDLPDHEQDSYALLVAGADGDLVKMPILPPDANKLERVAEINLSEDGSVSGKISQKAFGQSASQERAKMSMLSAGEYKANLDKWLTTRIKGGEVTSTTPTDHKNDGEFDLDIEFLAPMYAQIMQGRLMMFKPAMVGRLDQFSPVEGQRMTPILIDSSSYSETIKIKLPAGFVVDEMPEPDKIETPYGKYVSKCEVAGGYLLFSRSLVLNRTIVPPSGYDDVRKFYSVVRNAEQTPVVL